MYITIQMIHIYLLKHPITKEIKYVGKTSNLKRRYEQHIYISCKGKNHLANWLNSLKKENLKPEIESIDFVDKEVWKEKEIYWIAYYKQLGFKLCNHTIGGDGQNGAALSDETKQKMSLAHAGKVKSQEHRDNLSIAHTGKKLSDEHKEKMRKSYNKIGSVCNWAIINEEIALQIINLLKIGEKPRAIATKFKVTIDLVYQIKYKRTWKHLQ